MSAETWYILDKLGLLHTCTATVLGVCALVLAAGSCEGGLGEKKPGAVPALGRDSSKGSKTEVPQDTQLNLLSHAGDTSAKTYFKRDQKTTEQQGEREA